MRISTQLVFLSLCLLPCTFARSSPKKAFQEPFEEKTAPPTQASSKMTPEARSLWMGQILTNSLKIFLGVCYLLATCPSIKGMACLGKISNLRTSCASGWKEKGEKELQGLANFLSIFMSLVYLSLFALLAIDTVKNKKKEKKRLTKLWICAGTHFTLWALSALFALISARALPILAIFMPLASFATESLALVTLAKALKKSSSSKKLPQKA